MVIDKIYELINKSNIINENVNILKIKNSKNIIIVGDSYTEGYNPDGNVPSWTERFKYIINPEKLYVNYKGGTGFGFKVDDVDFLKLIQTVQGVTGKNKIRGLTTAAGLWASACMGLAIGVGYYKVAIIGNIFIFLITWITD